MIFQIDNIIPNLKQEDKVAQKWLFDQYKGLFYAICLRYMKQKEDAEDALLNGFYKILTKIDSYDEKGSFEGWMKRIVINECLMTLRKNKNFQLTVDIENVQEISLPKALSNLTVEEILQVIDLLPTGYKTVFNLYEIDGYKHREIAEILGISINTSKSQLILAKKRLRELLKKKQSFNFQGNHSITKWR